MAAPRGGPPRRCGGSACPSSSPRARPRALCAVVLAAARLPRAAFLRLCGRLPRGRRLPAARALPSSGALARRRPVLGFPPPRPAAAGRCSPSAPLRCAAGCAPPRALRSPSPRCGLPLVALRSGRAPCWAAAAPAGPPCLAAGAGLLGCGAAPPRAGALGPLRGPRGAAFRAPARGGCLGLAGAAARLPSVKAKASGPRCGPALTAGAAVGMVWARAKGPNLQARA